MDEESQAWLASIENKSKNHYDELLISQNGSLLFVLFIVMLKN